MRYDVQDDSRLSFTRKETNLFSLCLHKDMRVIANDGSNWVLDPGSTKGEFLLEDLDYGKETNISINLGS